MVTIEAAAVELVGHCPSVTLVMVAFGSVT